MENEEKQFVNVYTESNPNPNSLKFVLNFYLMENGSVDFPDVASTDNCPLAKELFEQFSFVQRVFITANFVTITKSEATDWYEVQNEVRAFIKKYFDDKRPVFLEAIKEEVVEATPDVEDDEVVARIKTVLDEYVRPAVEQDGGAINFHSFDNGIVKVLLQGSCSGCPSSTLTLKSGIENLLTRMVPQVKEVVAEGV